ncbi:MAG: hypothetical protein C0631_11930 [Sedimenticola sp.]|jgi:hypothetical protein|nr:MAG: hypothetical protein C0631_11930 [Sedimenticola sp.]
MSNDTLFDSDDDDDAEDSEELDTENLEEIDHSLKTKKNYNLEARRKIEQLMELRRLKEYSDDIEWQDLY